MKTEESSARPVRVRDAGVGFTAMLDKKGSMVYRPFIQGAGPECAEVLLSGSDAMAPDTAGLWSLGFIF
jgi:hypothetical protein